MNEGVKHFVKINSKNPFTTNQINPYLRADIMAPMEFIFTEAEIAEIQGYVAKYPERRSAVMPALWIAQEKFGWLSQDAIRLVADTLTLPYAQVYGVASFYTMYFKEPVPKHLIEVCTSFSCSVMGGPEMVEYVREQLSVDDNGISEDKKIWVREAECLGACDTAPMCQISNRRYAHNLTKEKMDGIIEMLRRDEALPFESIPLSDQSSIE